MQQKNPFYNKITKKHDEEIYDLLLGSINEILFDYSDHHLSNRKTLKSVLKNILVDKLKFIFHIKSKFSSKSENVIISNAYVNLKFKNTTSLLPPWMYSLKKESCFSKEVVSIIEEIDNEIEKRSVKLLMSDSFIELIKTYQVHFLKFLKEKNIKALFFANDLGFYENLSIKTAKKSNIPSFVYLHGLPARYNNIDDNRADYLIVWGQGIKDLYIANGVSEEKILTLPHPLYSKFEETKLESNFDNVLVLSKAISATPCISTELILPDRSTLLFYLELVKENLKKLGVTKASLRLHPSEAPDFYVKNMPDDFFSVEILSKEESLVKTTLVIGPTSTMLLDAIKAGKNYILFDPVFDGLTLEDAPLVAPFNGNSFVKLSNDFLEMKANIENPDININFKKLNEFFAVNSNNIHKIEKIIFPN